MRNLTATAVNRLVKIPGIITSATKVRSRATCYQLKCSKCGHLLKVNTDAEFSTANIPSLCQAPRSENDGAMGESCAPNSYRVIQDDSSFVDQQTLKLQEAPE